MIHYLTNNDPAEESIEISIVEEFSLWNRLSLIRNNSNTIAEFSYQNLTTKSLNKYSKIDKEQVQVFIIFTKRISLINSTKYRKF